jgi:hypothetical protein
MNRSTIILSIGGVIGTILLIIGLVLMFIKNSKLPNAKYDANDKHTDRSPKTNFIGGCLGALGLFILFVTIAGWIVVKRNL